MIELIFIPAPGVGHMVSMVEMAKLILARDQRLSITVFVLKRPGANTDSAGSAGSFARSLSDNLDPTRIRFIDLREPDPDSVAKLNITVPLFAATIELQKPIVREAIATQVISRPNSGKFGGILVDMFCASLVDVAKEFDVPCYIYVPSGASFLGLLCYMSDLRDEQGKDESEFMNSEAVLEIPIFSNPVPAKVFPLVFIDKSSGSTELLDLSKKFSMANGIVINTFSEIESSAIRVLSNNEKLPPIYPVGPILNHKKHSGEKHDEIMRWLDGQPASSVVFLCFGSMGTFGKAQVKEIALALEQSGHRFLWALRRPPTESRPTLAKEYDDPREILPEGFLERTGEMGKLIGWAPQVEVLSHKAVGGFVSHCGWNSTLESLWCNVPVATWPLHAEQQMNAFVLLKELKLGVEIKMDYRKNFIEDDTNIVSASVIENAIRRLMEGGGIKKENDEMRKRLKEMSQKCKGAVLEGGSSFISLRRFIDDVIHNVS